MFLNPPTSFAISIIATVVIHGAPKPIVVMASTAPATIHDCLLSTTVTDVSPLTHRSFLLSPRDRHPRDTPQRVTFESPL